MKKLVFFFVLLSSSLSLAAKLKVVTTLPEIAEAARAIGGDFVEVQSLLQGTEDPHYAEARPDFILKVNKADVVCFVGLDLEIGWLPKVMEKAGNAKVQKGGIGFCDLGSAIRALDVPTGSISRALGDVHPHGNPHFLLSPNKLAEGSVQILKTLATAMPEQKNIFEKNYDALKNRLSVLQSDLSKKVKKVKVMEYHKEFTYFFNAYGLDSLGSLEEKPGMPPSAARIAKVAQLAKENKVAVLFATPASPHKVLERFHELSGIPVVQVPAYVQLHQKSPAKSIEDLQKLLVNSIP